MKLDFYQSPDSSSSTLNSIQTNGTQDHRLTNVQNKTSSQSMSQPPVAHFAALHFICARNNCKSQLHSNENGHSNMTDWCLTKPQVKQSLRNCQLVSFTIHVLHRGVYRYHAVHMLYVMSVAYWHNTTSAVTQLL